MFSWFKWPEHCKQHPKLEDERGKAPKSKATTTGNPQLDKQTTPVRGNIVNSTGTIRYFPVPEHKRVVESCVAVQVAVTTPDQRNFMIAHSGIHRDRYSCRRTSKITNQLAWPFCNTRRRSRCRARAGHCLPNRHRVRHHTFACDPSGSRATHPEEDRLAVFSQTEQPTRVRRCGIGLK